MVSIVTTDLKPVAKRRCRLKPGFRDELQLPHMRAAWWIHDQRSLEMLYDGFVRGLSGRGFQVLCRPYGAWRFSCAPFTQGVALGCSIMPFQGGEMSRQSFTPGDLKRMSLAENGGCGLVLNRGRGVNTMPYLR